MSVASPPTKIQVEVENQIDALPAVPYKMRTPPTRPLWALIPHAMIRPFLVNRVPTNEDAQNADIFTMPETGINDNAQAHGATS